MSSSSTANAPQSAHATSSIRRDSATPDGSLFGWKRPPLTDDRIRTCWARDDRTKTCKCETCGTRVRSWSWRCVYCTRHICSVCVEPRAAGADDFPRRAARSHLDAGCWCLRFRSNMDPALAPSIRRLPRATRGRGMAGADGMLDRPKTPSPGPRRLKREVDVDRDVASDDEHRSARKLKAVTKPDPDGDELLDSAGEDSAESLLMTALPAELPKTRQ